MVEDEDLPDSMFLVAADDNPDGQSPQTLGFSRTPTVLLTFAANRFTRSAAREYQSRFGIGSMDWRMLVMLTRVPGSSVTTASRTMGIDKGAVSRSLQRLKKNELAADVSKGADERRKEWRLTDKGKQLHDRILDVALERQKKLLSGVSAEDVELFNSYLQKFLDNLDELNKETGSRS